MDAFKLAEGMKVAVFPAYVKVPATGIPLPSFRLKVGGISAIVTGLRGSLNVTVTVGRSKTPVALFRGLVELIEGGVVSELDAGGDVVPPPPLQAPNPIAQNIVPKRIRVAQIVAILITLTDAGHMGHPRGGGGSNYTKGNSGVEAARCKTSSNITSSLPRIVG